MIHENGEDMGNAIDAFRAQREAAEQLRAQLSALSELLGTLHQQIASLALNEELKTILRDEQRWLAQAENTIAAVRRWREREMYAFWWPLLWRWVVVCAFAMASAALAGAGYAWVSQPYAAEKAALRSRAELADRIEHRLLTMTPAERQQFERLMRLKTPQKPQ
jgi:hypothetical protein